MTSHELVPPSFEAGLYRTLYPDAAMLADEALAQHWSEVGVPAGRQGNRLATRADFVELVPKGAFALEIGPSNKPLLNGPNVMYFDVLDASGIDARTGQDPAMPAPPIHFVSPTGDLSIVDRKFEFVLSSHCIEHQLDLIDHLRKVHRLLIHGGRYYLLIPDCRYCFDHFLAPSTIAGVIDSVDRQRSNHTLRSVIEHRALTTHNDAQRHWRGDHHLPGNDVVPRIKWAMEEYARGADGYIDVHAWQFTPETFTHIIDVAARLGLIEFTIEEVYPTRYGANEFWAVLRAR